MKKTKTGLHIETKENALKFTLKKTYRKRT